MASMQFLSLSLLSQRERRALHVPFRKPVTVLVASNNMGKSAVIKSLYDTFGASPHQIDLSWTQAGVSSAVEFSVAGQKFTAVKSSETYAVFGANGEPLLRTRKVTEELAPFLARIIDFKLVMADRNDQIVIPPPAYMFAPFYVDQDKGWADAWNSFSGLNLPNSKKVLFEYHSGIRTNEYYEAMAERERLRAEHLEVVRERSALDKTYVQFRKTMGDGALNYRLDDFKLEVSELVTESTHLHKEQAAYRQQMSELADERAEWEDHQGVLSKALGEICSSFAVAINCSEIVDCPTCGAQYTNSIIERFGLIENEDGVLAAMLGAGERIQDINVQMKALATKTEDIEQRLLTIQRIMQARKEGITFQDVIVAESRSEASRAFRARLTSLDTEANVVYKSILDQTQIMGAASSRRKAQEVKRFFADAIAQFAEQLDVRASSGSKTSDISGRVDWRGSERPRALLAYYYAFLHATGTFGTSAFCPIVVDAPNQQGQDDVHMPAIMNFIVQNRPVQSQVIVAGEKLFGIEESRDVAVVNIGNIKNHVLRDSVYEQVAESLRPLLGNLL